MKYLMDCIKKQLNYKEPLDQYGFPHTGILLGLTTDHRWFATVSHAVRARCEQLTGSDYGLLAIRDPHTHERTGYIVGAASPQIIQRIQTAYIKLRMYEGSRTAGR